MHLPWNTGKLCSLLHKFGDRLFRGDGVSTGATQFYPDAAWKRALGQFKQVVTTTSGARWFGDCQGEWKLLESNGVELETAIRELLEHLGIQVLSRSGDPFDKGVDPSILATLYEMGLRLDMECLKKAIRAQGEARCPHCGRKLKENSSQPEDRHTG